MGKLEFKDFLTSLDAYLNSRLKPLDIEFMKQLHTRVNIVPVIAKADCLTKDELKKFKAQVGPVQCFCERLKAIKWSKVGFCA